MTVLCEACYGNPEKAPKSLHHGGNSWVEKEFPTWERKKE